MKTEKQNPGNINIPPTSRKSISRKVDPFLQTKIALGQASYPSESSKALLNASFLAHKASIYCLISEQGGSLSILSDCVALAMELVLLAEEESSCVVPGLDC